MIKSLEGHSASDKGAFMQSFDEECRKADVDERFSKPEIVTAKEVSQAEAKSNQARDRLHELQSRLSNIIDRETSIAVRIKRYETLRMVRQFCDDWITRIGLLIIAPLAVCGFVVILCHLVGLPAVFWVIPLLVVLGSAGFFGTKLFKPDDNALVSEMDSWSRQLHTLQNQQEETQAAVLKASDAFNRLHAKHQNVLTKFNSRINRLRSMNWIMLQGVPFEQFLKEIFIEWAYEVSTTKVTGDQGVDLIVAKNGMRAAIQAKGYVSSTVGNSAIQEAHTGMVHYRCQKCAVITNSTFTSGARQLAESVGCRLIDHDMIPLLIEGKINL
jgi:HJR/Mrr/RecB family endonuclease